MKRIITLLFAVSIMTAILITGCQQERPITTEQIPDRVVEKISQMGFNPDGIIKIEEGYLIERDIIIREADLEGPRWDRRIPAQEQYHTFNLVTGTPRSIQVFIEKSMGSDYAAGLQTAVDRFNAESLSLTFSITSSRRSADIVVEQVPRFAGYLAAAGFPTDDGEPFGSFKVNKKLIDAFVPAENLNNFLATLFTHEIGHCIGFRHTDWFDRSFSCGGDPVFEGGENTIGAEHIPGTPTGADPGSFMLSCLGANTDRPFTSADKVALDYLY